MTPFYKVCLLYLFLHLVIYIRFYPWWEFLFWVYMNYICYILLLHLFLISPNTWVHSIELKYLMLWVFTYLASSMKYDLNYHWDKATLPHFLINVCNFKVCSYALFSGRTFLGVSWKFPLIALLLIHISMFLAELGFLQTLYKINFIKFTFRFSLDTLEVGCLNFLCITSYFDAAFPTMSLSHIHMFLAGLSTPTLWWVFSTIVSIHGWLIFLRVLNGSSLWMDAVLRFLLFGWPEFF